MKNIFFLLLSSSYEKIQSVSDLIWKTQRYDLVCEYIEHPLLPPLIANLIEYLVEFIIFRIRSNSNELQEPMSIDVLAELEKDYTNKYFRDKRFKEVKI